MKEKKGFAQSMDAFFNGKGFYIVLFVCAAVIGISAWTLLFADKGPESGDVQVMQQADAGSEDGLSAFIGGNGADIVEPDGGGQTEPALRPEPALTPKPAEAPVSAAPAEAPSDNGTEKLVFVWPVAGSVLTPYSVAYPVFSKTMADWRTHGGVDIETEMGARVLAAADGAVIEVSEDEMYGTTVVIDHGGGLASVYSNLASTPVVSVGDAVTTAAVIGSVGDTAIAEAAEPPHLHFEMLLDGDNVDPASYMPAR